MLENFTSPNINFTLIDKLDPEVHRLPGLSNFGMGYVLVEHTGAFSAERSYSGWVETPEEARLKFLAIANNVREHPDFEAKVAGNADVQNSEPALERILEKVMLKRRRANVEEFKRFAQDEAYYQGAFNVVKQLVK